MRSRSDILTFQQPNIDLYRCYQTQSHNRENNSWSYFNPYLLPCRFVCNACSITTITVCTLIHNNNIMYNNIDCKSVIDDIWLTGNVWTMDHGP